MITNSTLSTLTLSCTVDGEANAARTVAAALPLRSKRSMSSWAKFSPRARGTTAE
jgi:hypothetical protein